jgi:hypothetical protein
LDRLAEDYLLDSDASVRVVVGLDIEYGKKGSLKATISVWRTHVASADNPHIVSLSVFPFTFTPTFLHPTQCRQRVLLAGTGGKR